MGLYKNQNGVLVPIAGRGKAEYGASTVRTGTITVNGDGSSQLITVNVEFAATMPDANYIVLIEPYTSAWEHTQWRTLNYTESGFRFDVVTTDGAVFPSVAKYTYTAIKLYTDAEYNNILSAMPSTANSTYKLLDKKVQRFSVAEDLNNALLNMPALSQLDFAIDANNLVVGGATFPKGTSWHVYSDGSGSSTFGGVGYRYIPNYNMLYHLAGGKAGSTLTLTITAVDTTDTDWKAATIDTTYATSGSVSYRRIGKVCYVHGVLNPKSTMTSRAQTFATGLPTSSRGAYTMCINNSTGSPVDIPIWINTNQGELRSIVTSAQVGVTGTFSLSYVVAT